jgi:Ion channel
MTSSLETGRARASSPRGGLFRHSVSIFLGVLVLYLVTLPFAQYLADPGTIEGPLLGVVLIAGVLAVGARGSAMLVAAGLALIALALRWLWHQSPSPVLHGAYLVPGMLVFLIVIVHLLRFILRAPRVDAEVLSAGIATYLLLALTWAVLYLIVGFLEPQAFSLPAPISTGKGFDGFNALYFSLVTLTTMGYGDITPAAPVTRMLAALEAVVGVLYLAVLIARLVTLYTDQRS